MKYYLDSCIVIYIVERITDYREQLIHLIPEDSELLVSDLTRMECRCKPIQTILFRIQRHTPVELVERS